MSDYRTLNDDCDGDSEGLRAALGEGFVVLHEEYDDSEGYGQHSANAVFLTADGRTVHAECGGCSCNGSGSWSYCESAREAVNMIPEQERGRLAPELLARLEAV